MAVPARASNPSATQPVAPLRRYAPLLAVLALCLLGGGAWWLGWLGRAEDPRVTELKQMQRDLAKQFSPTEGPKNFTEAAARVAAIGTVMTKMQSLPEELRPQAMAEGRSIMMQYMQARVDGYFALPPSKRDAFIDGEIRQMEFMRKAFEAGQTAMRFMGVGGARPGGQPAAGSTAAGSTKAGSTAPAAPPAAPRRPEGMGRGMSRKEMIDRTTPQQRAQFQEYFSQVEQRRKALGLPPGGGPPR